jgi:hypothetical protein
MVAILVSGALLLVLLLLSRQLERDRDRVLRCLLAQDGRSMRGLDFVTAGASNRGMVYVVLSDLEEEGLIRSRTVLRYDDIHGEYGAQVREYELTDAGRAVAHDLRLGRQSA